MNTQFTIERLPEPVVIAGRPSFEFAMVIPGHPDRYLVSRDHLMREFGGKGEWEGISVVKILAVLDYMGQNPEARNCVYSGFKQVKVIKDPLARLKEACGLAGTTDNHAVTEILSALEKFRASAVLLEVTDKSLQAVSEAVGPKVRNLIKRWGDLLQEGRIKDARITALMDAVAALTNEKTANHACRRNAVIEAFWIQSRMFETWGKLELEHILGGLLDLHFNSPDDLDTLATEIAPPTADEVTRVLQWCLDLQKQGGIVPSL